MKTILQQFITNVRAHPFSSSTTFLLSVSGGVDSMVLLNLFLQTKNLFAHSFTVLHMNHHLRENDSDQDEKLVTSYCLKNAIPFHMVHFSPTDWQSVDGTGIEEKARKLRRRTIKKILQENLLDVCVLGHTQDDLCETFMFNFIRGSSPEKLAGLLPSWNSETSIFRPLLTFTKKQIRAYAQDCNIPYREDSTNKDVQYSRNRLRNIILPEIQIINPNFSSSILRLQDILSHENDWMEQELSAVVKDWTVSPTSIQFSSTLFQNLPIALQRRSILHIRSLLAGHRDNFSFSTIETIRALILSHPQKKGILYSDTKMSVEVENAILIFRKLEASEC
jgi:tRNA(Ile)-lysidine synthase